MSAPSAQAPSPSPGPARRTRSVAIAAVAVLLLAAAAGFYIFYVQDDSSTTGPTSSCDAAAPLQLTSTQEVTLTQGLTTLPALTMKWYDCASESIQFNINASTLSITISSNGSTSQITGQLATGYVQSSSGGSFTAPAGGSVTVTADIEDLSSSTPDAQITHVSGTATATDPTTGHLLSGEQTIDT